jgi:hypothetical protein
LHHVAAEDIAFLILCKGDRYLPTPIGMAPVVSHTAQCRSDVIRVGAIIFRREGDVRLLFCAWLRCERSYCLSVSAIQSYFVAAILRKGDSLSASTFQSVGDIIGETTAIRLCVRCADGDWHHGRSTPGAVFARVEAIGGERMSDQRLAFKVLPAHASGIQATRQFIGR